MNQQQEARDFIQCLRSIPGLLVRTGRPMRLFEIRKALPHHSPRNVLLAIKAMLRDGGLIMFSAGVVLPQSNTKGAKCLAH